MIHLSQFQVSKYEESIGKNKLTQNLHFQDNGQKISIISGQGLTRSY